MKVELTTREYYILSIALTLLFDETAKDKSPMKNEVEQLSRKLYETMQSHVTVSELSTTP